MFETYTLVRGLEEIRRWDVSFGWKGEEKGELMWVGNRGFQRAASDLWAESNGGKEAVGSQCSSAFSLFPHAISHTWLPWVVSSWTEPLGWKVFSSLLEAENRDSTASSVCYFKSQKLWSMFWMCVLWGIWEAMLGSPTAWVQFPALILPAVWPWAIRFTTLLIMVLPSWNFMNSELVIGHILNVQ